jgi:hypothetical protein
LYINNSILLQIFGTIVAYNHIAICLINFISVQVILLFYSGNALDIKTAVKQCSAGKCKFREWPPINPSDPSTTNTNKPHDGVAVVSTAQGVGQSRGHIRDSDINHGLLASTADF